MNRNHQISVPLIKSGRPLRTGIVRDEEVEAYLALDREILKDRIGQVQKLVAVKHIPSFSCAQDKHLNLFNIPLIVD